MDGGWMDGWWMESFFFFIFLHTSMVYSSCIDITGRNSWDHDPKDHDLDHGHDLKSMIWTMIQCHDPWS